MGDFVQMSLKAYDELKSSNERLKRELKEERESHNRHIAQAERTIKDSAKIIEQYKQYILGRNCTLLNVNDYSLEYYLNINSWNYAINYKDDLFKLGITKQEMDKFIADKYEEFVKEKKEIKTTGGE